MTTIALEMVVTLSCIGVSTVSLFWLHRSRQVWLVAGFRERARLGWLLMALGWVVLLCNLSLLVLYVAQLKGGS